MSGKKYFVLMEGGNDTTQVFVSKQPRGAALKAATRGHTDIEPVSYTHLTLPTTPYV